LNIITTDDQKTAVFSQQLIIAEGGFKSKLDTPYANQWMMTTLMRATAFGTGEVYGDAGF
jgi:hypothetical protein